MIAGLHAIWLGMFGTKTFSEGLSWKIFALSIQAIKNIMMNISYDGRKNETAKTIHIARVEARYLF